MPPSLVAASAHRHFPEIRPRVCADRPRLVILPLARGRQRSPVLAVSHDAPVGVLELVSLHVGVHAVGHAPRGAAGSWVLVGSAR